MDTEIVYWEDEEEWLVITFCVWKKNATCLLFFAFVKEKEKWLTVNELVDYGVVFLFSNEKKQNIFI